MMRDDMDYLIDCACGHDLTQHGELGCRGTTGRCGCTLSKHEALDGAIERARISPWSELMRRQAAES